MKILPCPIAKTLLPLIAAYRRSPTDANRAALKKKVEKNYDAAAYCRWLSARDGKATYRLPTETEWEIAAGHMPKDADFNCGEHDGATPVDAYAGTLGACGAIDFWGNCWEWTSEKTNGRRAVKGGAYDSPRTLCRTENKDEARASGTGYANVTFRVVREE
ncbi:MAG: formylglycine-generating enzyme family protein [Candidatus Spyradosoma sp.]